MRKFTLLVAAILALGSAAFSAAVDVGGSAVEVIVDAGHGSGVYLGNGYVLTAAHVAKEAGDDGEVTVKRPRDDSWSDNWTAAVLWIDTVHDFALLKIKAVMPDDMPKTKVGCGPMTMGENVMIVGWPVDLGRVTSRGYVASSEGKHGPWPVSYVVVAPIFFGNSGGPVYNEKNEVIALAVGILNGTSLAIVVPTAAVCGQLPADVK